MKKTLLFLALIVSLQVSVTAACGENKLSGEELEKAWKVKMTEVIGNYARFSSYSLKSIKASGDKRFARLVRLERDCKEFQFRVSITGALCSPKVSLVSLESCQREE